ncbi:hypothetical protein GGX14DRAFT_151972 [Mycena pura]|uniref:Uncharacterized protein n=1 Tax=Mycena pura TaxID=153505 RepID=A0AAD6V5J1_9AGAR|nr:hypothetical protein GGX14DRAFT_151972 [Mycena pura]
MLLPISVLTLGAVLIRIKMSFRLVPHRPQHIGGIYPKGTAPSRRPRQTLDAPSREAFASPNGQSITIDRHTVTVCGL